MINSPMGPRDEIIVPGDLDSLVIWLVLFGLFKGRSMCDIWDDSDSDSES